MAVTVEVLDCPVQFPRNVEKMHVPVEGSPEAHQVIERHAHLLAEKRKNSGHPGWYQISFDQDRNYYDALHNLVTYRLIDRK
jgi:hypothetical protein